MIVVLLQKITQTYYQLCHCADYFDFADVLQLCNNLRQSEIE